jgi:peroxiredoxin
MKIIYRLLLLVMMFTGCSTPPVTGTAQQSGNGKSFSIEGSINGVYKGLALLTYIVDRSVRVDSSVINNGNFSFGGKLQQPQEVQLSFTNEHYNGGITFFAENTAIEVKADTAELNTPVIRGSSAQQEFEQYKMKLLTVNLKFEALNHLAHDIFVSGQLSKSVGDSLTAKSQQLDSEKTIIISSFVKTNPGSVVSAWAISKNLLYEPDPEVLEPLFNALSAANQSGIYGSIIHEAIVSVKATSIGRPAIDFTQPDSGGKPIALSSFKGKYVLVDFWASWCGPCRAENPNVVKAYNQYKSRGFEILGVSLDSDKGAWLKAINKDNLAWAEVSDLKAWNNTASLAYGVKGIPFNLLLDKNGIIIAKNLRGINLQNKLKEIFTN